MQQKRMTDGDGGSGGGGVGNGGDGVQSIVLLWRRV